MTSAAPVPRSRGTRAARPALLRLLPAAGAASSLRRPEAAATAVSVGVVSVDHLVPAFLLGDRAPRLPLVLTGYALTALVAWQVFRSVPPVALVVFVVVSALHFGLGEVSFDDERAGRPLHRDPLAVLATGGAALVLPVTGDRDSTAPVIALVVPGSSGRLPTWSTRAAVGIVLAAAAVTIVRRLRLRRYLPAGEVALLVTAGLLVPPLAAFGAYFGGWHAVRHVARLVSEDPANATDLARGRVLGPLRRFSVAAAAPTAVSLAALAALWSLAGGWRGFVTADLAVLAGLTVRHALVVAWWDRRTLRPAAP